MAESSRDPRVDGLIQRVNGIEGSIADLERKMAEMARAVNEAARYLGMKLDEVRQSVDLDRQEVSGRVDTTNERMALAVTGIAATTAAVIEHRVATMRNFEQTQALVTKQTSAVVQMEVIRAFNEARGLKSKIVAFTEEIDERFEKAIEGVFINRILYDKHFQAIFDEYNNKVRTIGEHIYAIWESDLKPAENAARIPQSSYQELAVEVDLERLARRSAQLDQDLEVVFETGLGPRLDMDRSFERALSSTYGVPSPAEPGTRAAAAAVFLAGSGGQRRIVCDGASVPALDASAAVDVQQADALGSFGERAQDGQFAERIAKAAVKRPMTDAEADEFRRAIGRVVARGLVPATLLPGIEAYLTKVPLQILAEQEVKV